MFERVNRKALSLYVRGQTALERTKARFSRACRHARQGTAYEAGQGFTEYIIIIAGVLLIGAAIFVLFRTIRSKYESANSSVGGIPITSGW